MSEYIITDKQLAVLVAKCDKIVNEDGTPFCDPKEIAEIIDEPVRLEEIVHCIACTWFANDAMHGAWCKKLGVSLHDDYDGYCAWAKRRES